MLETQSNENMSGLVQTSVTEPHDTLFPASDPVEKLIWSLLTSGGQRLEEIAVVINVFSMK